MIRKQVWALFQIVSLVTCEFAADHQAPQFRSANITSDDAEIKDKKVLNLFNVVSFDNDVCIGSTKNGTCYTSDECTNLGGVSDGTCASGFGVCCTFTLSCGGSSSQNCTYIEQTSTTSLTTNPCMYTITKNADDICRIRFDFLTFSIETPVAGTVLATGTLTLTGASYGDCEGDSFTLTSPGAAAPPLICGFNTGQHMYVDASDDGHIASFQLSSSTSTSRSWMIKATQYTCNGWKAGPPGCLQYFTSETGTVASFNFPTTSSTVTSSAQHLSSQHYSMCFRRGSGKCAICFTPVISTTTAVIAQSSFGLSVSPSSTAAQSGVTSECTSDYIGITHGVTAAIAAISTITTPGIFRICGRIWAAATAQTTVVSLCSRSRPFRLLFYADEDEVNSTAAAATTDELDNPPGGIVGFNLAWTQLSC